MSTNATKVPHLPFVHSGQAPPPVATYRKRGIGDRPGWSVFDLSTVPGSRRVVRRPHAGSAFVSACKLQAECTCGGCQDMVSAIACVAAAARRGPGLTDSRYVAAATGASTGRASRAVTS
uniref:Uncharacterized protein n=1 Tax=Setaria viridis TaxID=4556 RepID=A0A4U6T7B5_SETVI|nr:hypothetical protein SEVIR_9G512833v2 [Setaria viridis]